MMLLTVSNLDVVLGGLRVLHDINIVLNPGELVAVVGANGAGKSTLLRTIAGLDKPVSGEIKFEEKLIIGMSANKIADLGISLVPEGKKLFYQMTVLENLKIGAYKFKKDKARIQKNIERVFDLFPVLGNNRNRIAGTFSGGEQQMLTIGRGLMSDPKILMIDELSLGLAPKVVDMLMQIIKQLNRQGMSIILVEQNVKQVLKIADRGYVIENGDMALTGTGLDLLANEHVRIAYLGL